MKTKRKATASLSLSLSDDSVVETPPSRRTRSQSVPEWSVEETLVLVSEIASLDQDWLKALSSYQKWKMISDSCTAMRVSRSSTQCKRRWESLLSDYETIVAWESSHGRGSYWSLDAPARLEHRLPAAFDQQVFGSIDALLNAQDEEEQSSEEDANDSGKQLVVLPDNRLVCVAGTDADLGFAEMEIMEKKQTPFMESLENVVEIENMLPKNTEQIKTIENMNNIIESANELEETAEQIYSMESALVVANTHQENVEQMHVVTILNNTPGIEDKSEKNMGEERVNLLEEKLKQIHAIEIMDSKSQDNDRQIHTSPLKIVVQINVPLQEDVDEVHTINSSDDVLEISNKLEEDAEDRHILLSENKENRHVSETMENEPKMENKLVENAKERDIIESFHHAKGMPKVLEDIEMNDKALDIVNLQGNGKQITNKLQENVEQTCISLMEDVECIHESQNMDNIVEITNKVTENIEQTHVPLMKDVDLIHVSKDNAVEMANKLEKITKQPSHATLMEDVQQLHVIESIDNTTGMTNKVYPNLEQNCVTGNMKNAFAMTSKVQWNTEKSTNKPLKMTNKLQENVEQTLVSNNAEQTPKITKNLPEWQENMKYIQAIKITDKALKMANKLQMNAEQIHTVLKGDIPEYGKQGLDFVDLAKPNAVETEYMRRRADELIKAFGMFVGTLDQFTELIKDRKCEIIKDVDSLQI